MNQSPITLSPLQKNRDHSCRQGDDTDATLPAIYYNPTEGLLLSCGEFYLTKGKVYLPIGMDDTPNKKGCLSIGKQPFHTSRYTLFSRGQ